MVRQIFTIFFTIFIVIDPLGLIPVFLALTVGQSKKERRNTIFKSVLTALFVLSLFILFGRGILSFLGILPGSFFVAGGILLFITSLDLLIGHRQRTKISEAVEEKEDVSIFPLGIPMLAGPGTITTILLFVSESREILFVEAVLFGAVVATLSVALMTMFLSGLFLRIFKKTGVSIIQRIMGIILSGLAVQFIYEGLLKLQIIKAL